jgi:hypothetical protein
LFFPFIYSGRSSQAISDEGEALKNGQLASLNPQSKEQDYVPPTVAPKALVSSFASPKEAYYGSLEPIRISVSAFTQ